MSGGASSSSAVAVGGGHGLARTLAALPRVVGRVTAVVTVADDGGSSGRLRRDLGVLPPGDLRMAVTALARERRLAELLQYRFPRGELGGHSLGNLVLVALQDLVGGDLQAALDELCRVLDVPGRVLPCTTTPVTLHGRAGGSQVRGQASVSSTPGLERVWLEPADAAPAPAVLSAVAAADLVVLGPGSLYTSLLPNLLVPGLARALTEAAAPVVLVANLREQPGETQGMSLRDHLDALAAHVPGLRIDVCVAHDGEAPEGSGEPLRGVGLDDSVGRVVGADLLDGRDGHDPAALAQVFAALLSGR
ncbi:gluconeogenesis factor YvcK family protein [Egicoccus halophilus]|uniref:Putative gluconeogenesis factor n=1 Tax=Egicoccus halophilus TaxID=1670830 RepID=A0A8J3A8L0_9ACTN|nr:uridine diphosphate-N-acetylglucosamine-binding protein YvcK [Egicoccus halophilus]GGI04501.1 putative gluconeogenesis factor [Egicoccus halophilus]